ncbi:MAG: PAS domain S-box protein, partial [SAR324 cluster bacterium]|nr:PAS domain S-box protein [SAR324 cluster bacterium]
IAMWGKDQFCENFEYNLAGTPCEKVLDKQTCYHTESVRELYPQDWILRELKIESYMGTPLRDSAGKVTGLVGISQDITERKNAEAALQKSREAEARVHARLSDAIESLPASFALYDSEDRLVLCNRKTLEMFPHHAHLLKPGTKYEEIVRLSLEKNLVKFDEKKKNGYLKRRLQEHRLNGSAIELEWSDGRILEVYNRPTSDGGLVTIRLDVTERKRAEEGLRASEERIRQVVSNVPVVFWKLNREGVITLLEGKSLPGDSRQLLGKTIQEAFEEQPEIVAANEKALAGESVQAVVSASGGRVFDAYLSPIKDGNSDVLGVTGVAVEITDRVQAEEKLRASENRFRSLVENAADAIFLYDTEGNLIDVNQQACENLGYTREELLSLKVSDIAHSRTPAELNELFQNILSGKSPGTISGTNRRKDGTTYPVEIRMGVIDSGGEKMLLALARDVSERVAIENQLRQAQKMEAVGQLAGGVAHDFNNMLQIIQGYTELAILNSKGNGTQGKNLEKVLGATHKAANLTKQLLAFGRRQVLKTEVFDVNELIENLMKMLGRLIGETVILQVNPSAGPGNVYADPGLIDQVLVNLCVNARDAMPDGGQLTIETQPFHADQSFCETHGWSTPGEYVQISVTDTGIGIAKSDLSHIFEPFFTTKEVGRGTGLGLSVVYGIIQQHKGKITVHSEPGIGTTFKFYLPASKNHAMEEVKSIPEIAQGGHETILVAEDEQVLLEMVSDLLEDHGYSVLPARDGNEAVSIFQEKAQEIDLVILDVVMPNLGGREAYKRIKGIRPSVPVLFSTGYSASVLDSDFMEKNKPALLQKPYSPMALYKIVREQLAAAESLTNG